MDVRHSRQRTKLPVWRTLGAAYATVFGHPGDLFALAAVPLVISIAGESFILFDPTGVIAGSAENFGPDAATALTLLIRLLTVYLPWLVFVVAWNRLVLLGMRDRHGPVEFYFGAQRESILKGSVFLVAAVAGSVLVFSWIFSLLTGLPPNLHETQPPTNFFTLFTLALVFTPILIEFPAIFIGYKTDVPRAWKQNSWSVWRLFWILLLATFPFVILFFLAAPPDAVEATASGFPDRDLESAGDIMAVIVWKLASFLGTATLMTALSLSYRHAAVWRDRPKEEPPSPSEYMTILVLPMVLGLVLGGATAPVADFLSLSADDRFLLGIIAFIIGFFGMGFISTRRHRGKTRATPALYS